MPEMELGEPDESHEDVAFPLKGRSLKLIAIGSGRVEPGPIPSDAKPRGTAT